MQTRGTYGAWQGKMIRGLSYCYVNGFERRKLIIVILLETLCNSVSYDFDLCV